MSSNFLKSIRYMCKAFFYGCKVKLLPAVPIETISKIETRILTEDIDTPVESILQYNASQLLSYIFRVYGPAYPKAICIIAVTTEDLYPDENETFVFGLANIMT